MIKLFFLALLMFQSFAQNSVLMIEIDDNDIAQLSSWPPDRRWYGSIAEQCLEQNAQLILFDIAFPKKSAKKLSDEFFLSVLKDERILIRSHIEGIAKKETLRIFGNVNFPRKRFLPLLKEELTFEKNFIRLKKGSFHFLNAAETELAIPYPDSVEIEKISLHSIMNNTRDLSNTLVLIAFDVDGITSYIKSPNTNHLFTSSELFAWSIQSYISGNYRKILNPFIFVPVLLICLALIILFWHQKKKKAQYYLLATMFLLFLTSSFFYYLPLFYPVALFFLQVLFLLWEKFTKTSPRVDTEYLEEKKELSDTIDSLEKRLEYYEAKTPDEVENFHRLDQMVFSESSPMKNLLQRAAEFAKSNLHIFIHGETGSGKELLAQFIQENSPRSSAPFIAINCAAIPENLIESELFGHEAGAFTGAIKQKIGKFEQADGGSIFLDEIADAPLHVQVKLLRVIQEGRFERVGGTKTIHSDVRIISATHKAIQDLIETKQFREDLYYRLAGVELKLLPLRERKNDIRALFYHFISEESDEIKKNISQTILDWLEKQAWEGNVRQLKSATERALINMKINQRKRFIPSDFELKNSSIPKPKTLDERAELILNTMREFSFKHQAISKTSEKLMMHRVTVTEYFRALIVHFFVHESFNKKEMLLALAKGVEIENFTQYQKRIERYLDTIIKKINDGKKKKMNSEEIIKAHFYNFPSPYHSDLKKLIEDWN